MNYSLTILRSLPPGLMGMSLGLCGGASIYLEFGLVENSRMIEAISNVFYQFHNGAATFLLLLFSIRIFSDYKKAIIELKTVDIVPPYASGQMAFLFITGRFIIYLFGMPTAHVFVYIFAFIQMVLMIWFFYLCWQTSTYPEPFWNPPTVNCSVTTIIGAILGLPQWLTVGSFLLGIFLQIILVPPQVYRTVMNPKVSPSIATNMMQAPCSLNAITWGIMRRYKLHLPKSLGFSVDNDFIQSKEFEDIFTHVLFILSVLVVWLTFYSLYIRRINIIHKGFHPGWAVLTFPTCSSAVATLQYCGLKSKDLATPQSSYHYSTWQLVLKIYGISFSLFTCFIVLGVFIGYITKCFFISSSSSSSLFKNDLLDNIKELSIEKDDGKLKLETVSQESNIKRYSSLPSKSVDLEANMRAVME